MYIHLLAINNSKFHMTYCNFNTMVRLLDQPHGQTIGVTMNILLSLCFSVDMTHNLG